VTKKTSELLDHPYFEMVRHDITEPHYAEVDEIYNWPVGFASSLSVQPH
jgi:hypothetical protein